MTDTSPLRIGEVFRYPIQPDATAPIVDGLRNWFFETHLPDSVHVMLARGINPIRTGSEKLRLDSPAAILIRSSPHRAGSIATPWDDFFDPDNGQIRYFGDHKPEKKARPELSPGNALLLGQRALHASPSEEDRKQACPLLFFLAVRHDGRTKGNIKFQGVGVIERAQVVSQWSEKHGRSFSNYRFDCVVLSLAQDNERVSWEWVNARRKPGATDAKTLALAPKSWREWVKHGSAALPRLRRSVARQRTAPASTQRPTPGSPEAKVLNAVYSYYEGNKHHFEGLAEVITERVFATSTSEYARGWITRRGRDHGADFVGRLDVGTGFARTRLVVLGQAKCESLSTATSGKDIARTAARLRRGWIGVYVTTSYFSRDVQVEVIEDEYPLILVNGLQVAEILLEMMFEQGLQDVTPILKTLEDDYASRVSFRQPSEILLD